MNGDRQTAERPSPHTPHPVQTGGVHVTFRHSTEIEQARGR